MCNKEIKFGLFYDWAMAQGFDYVATGHYADSQNGQLLIPTDKHKDQTYFLYRLNKNQLEHILFPLSNLTKPEVRVEAMKRKIHTAQKKDSVGICFIGDINVHNFLKERLGENPGDVVDVQGRVIGKHQGLWFYTIGQRHGFEVDKHTLISQSSNDGDSIIKSNFPPFFVISKNAEKNQLIVGFGVEALRQKFKIRDLHWIDEQQKAPTGKNILVRIRHTGELLAGQIIKEEVILTKPIPGIAAGQSAVFYTLDDESSQKRLICLGGGVIDV
jgi:tRNA-specific 2-thiouridylase